ncbi:hypothetical protein [Streptomyces sp. st140]|jgi:hypothetical protein|uniref:hypothetical protein n=1 Tax=Streptomyces sp. st140 TaxID=1828052 RepID=UPI00211D3050|nr:hypothetical protein [Streptomyces sp. st140]
MFEHRRAYARITAGFRGNAMASTDRTGGFVSARCYTNSQRSDRSWRPDDTEEEAVAKPPEGYYKVRSHYRRKPRPSAKKLSGWSIAGLVAVVWLWSQLIGFGEASPTTPQTPTPSVSASVGR